MKYISIIFLMLILSGCATTDSIASKNGFTSKYIQTSKFNLASQQKIQKPGENIHIYIEGDGHAWISRTRLSSDPTPQQPTVMKLAALDQHPNIVYLARPCQFSKQDLKTVCNPKYWSLARYSPEIIEALNEAISTIMLNTNSNKVDLIGFSGGGSLAVLVAANRNGFDIASIRTIAGNLDLKEMDRVHKTTPLSESVDPISIAYQIRDIPQVHFSGGKDKIVPTIVAQNFIKAANLDDKHLVVIKNASHHKNWEKHWPNILKQNPAG